MINLVRIRAMTADELADFLGRVIWRCTRDCPALAQCREGIGCRAAILAWLLAEEES